LGRIIVALTLSVVVAGSTSAIAWLLDPAVKKIFIDQDKTFAIFIPILVVFAFAGKGISLYFARLIVIVLGNRIKQALQNKMTDNILLSDSQTIESKHTGKYISTFLYESFASFCSIWAEGGLTLIICAPNKAAICAA